MRRTTAIVDTGPLVAYLNARDRWHEWAVEQLSQISPPLSTCEAVITETCHLARRDGGDADGVLALIERGLLRVEFNLESKTAAVRKLMLRYRDAPMSLADGCLVVMSESWKDRPILTLDAHFTRYRRHSRHIIPIISPENP
jgi:uncharacterized protein